MHKLAAAKHSSKKNMMQKWVTLQHPGAIFYFNHKAVIIHAAGCSRLTAVHSRSRYFNLTCPRSRVTFTSLYPGPLDRGGLCHHRSVPSMALVTGRALLGSTELQ